GGVGPPNINPIRRCRGGRARSPANTKGRLAVILASFVAAGKMLLTIAGVISPVMSGRLAAAIVSAGRRNGRLTKPSACPSPSRSTSPHIPSRERTVTVVPDGSVRTDGKSVEGPVRNFNPSRAMTVKRLLVDASGTLNLLHYVISKIAPAVAHVLHGGRSRAACSVCRPSDAT